MISISFDITRDDVHVFSMLEKAHIQKGWSEKMLEAAFLSGSSLFAKAICCDEIVGYINYSLIIDEMEINAVALAPEYRRKGIGRLLVEGALEHAKSRGARQAFLEVNETNYPAIRLYQKCGFELAYQRKNYYGKQAALVYTRKLHPR